MRSNENYTIFFVFKDFFQYACVCTCVNAEKYVMSLGAGVAGVYESLEVGSGN